jgi:hypothetical protein
MVLPRLGPSVNTGATSTGEGIDLAVSLLDGPATVADTTLDRWVLVAQGEELASGPLEAASTVLVADGLVADGDVTVRWDRYTCEGPCPVAAPDGTPSDGGARVTTVCEELVPSDLARATVTFQSVDGAPGGATCPVDGVDELPPLTVPPSWSLREPYPATCGAAGLPVGQETGELFGPEDTFDCVREHLARGEPVEYPSGVVVGAAGSPSVTLRVEGVDTLVVISGSATAGGAGWTRQVCDDVGLPGYGFPGAVGPTGCGAEEPMSLDPP